MLTLLLAMVVQAVPQEAPRDLLAVLNGRGFPVDTQAAARAADEAVLRLADPGVRFFDAAGAAAFEAQMAGPTNPPVPQDLGEGLFLFTPGVINEAAVSGVASGLAAAAAGGGGFILDCRGADGANLACVDALAGRFLPPDRFLYAVQNGRGEDVELHSAPRAERAAVPVLMLINGETTGTAQLLAALFERPGGVVLVGAPTRGEAVRRELTPLSEGRYALLATGRFVRPDGAAWPASVVPHITVDSGGVAPAQLPLPTNALSRTGRSLGERARRHLELFSRVRQDPALSRAVDLLLGLKAMALLPENPDAPVPPLAASH
jgi:hypothetical protein